MRVKRGSPNEFDAEPENQLVTFKGRTFNREEMIFGGFRPVQNDDRVDWMNPPKSPYLLVEELSMLFQVGKAKCASIAKRVELLSSTCELALYGAIANKFCAQTWA